MASPVDLALSGTDLGLPSWPHNLPVGCPLPVDTDGGDSNHQQHLEAQQASYEEWSTQYWACKSRDRGSIQGDHSQRPTLTLMLPVLTNALK